MFHVEQINNKSRKFCPIDIEWLSIVCRKRDLSVLGKSIHDMAVK